MRGMLEKICRIQNKHWDMASLVLIVAYVTTIGIIAPYQFFGDSAVHAWISKQIWSSGGVVSDFNFVVNANGTKMPINYPLFFHFALSLSNMASSNFPLNLQVFILLFSMVLALSFYVLVRFIFNRQVAFMSLIVLLGSSQMFTLSIIAFMEPFLFAFVLMSVFYLFRFLKSRDSRHLHLSCFFLGVSIATKQSVLIVLIPLVLWLVLMKRNVLRETIHLKTLLVALFLIVIVVAPFFYYQISTTGTITYPPEGPTFAFISQKIFQLVPKVGEDPRSSEYIRVSMGQENLGTFLLADLKRTNRLFYPFNLNDLNITYLLFFVLLFMGVLASVKNTKDLLSLQALLIVVSFPFILTVSANPRYYLLVFIFTIPFICLGLRRTVGKHKLIFLLLLFTVVLSSAATFYDNSVHTDDISRGYIETGYFNTEFRYYSLEAYGELSSLHPTGLVLSGQWPETMLYGNSTVTWISPFGGSDYIDLLKTSNLNVIGGIIQRYNIQYVVINKMDKINTSTGPLKESKFYEMLKNGTYGRKVYANEWVSIYEVRP